MSVYQINGHWHYRFTIRGVRYRSAIREAFAGWRGLETAVLVLGTLGRIAPQLAGNTLAAAAGPAHSGLFSRAEQMDRRVLLDEQALSRELASIGIAIRRGDLDHIPLLDEVIEGLNAREFSRRYYNQSCGHQRASRPDETGDRRAPCALGGS